jgi:hypothetical protein
MRQSPLDAGPYPPLERREKHYERERRVTQHQEDNKSLGKVIVHISETVLASFLWLDAGRPGRNRGEWTKRPFC